MKDRTKLFMILFLCVLLRLTLIFGLKTYTNVELFEYNALANNFMNGQGYTIEHFGTTYYGFYKGLPYLFITTVIYYLFPPGYIPMLIMQSIFSLLSVFLIYKIGSLLHSKKIGLLAALITAFHPGIVYYDVYKLHPLSFDSLTIILTTYLFLLFSRLNLNKIGFVAGLSTGISILQRSPFFLFLPFGLYLIFRRSGAKRILKTATYFLGVSIIIFPLLIYNATITPKFVGLTTTSGESFWRGNAPWSYGSSYAAPGKTVLDLAPQSFLDELNNKDELEQNEFFWKEGLKYFYENPVLFSLKVVRKFFYFWTFGPMSGITYPELYFYLFNLYYLVLLVFTLKGFLYILKNKRAKPFLVYGSVIIFLIFFSISFAHSLFYSELRHRWAIEPIMIVFSSIGILHTSKLRIFQSHSLKKELT